MARFAAIAVLVGAAAPLASASGAGPCRSMLTPQEARAVAIDLPNPRAFAENQHAVLSTALVGRASGGAVLVRVTAKTSGAAPLVVGTYLIDLRSGRATDNDDQESADDDRSRQQAAHLVAKHCPK